MHLHLSLMVWFLGWGTHTRVSLTRETQFREQDATLGCQTCLASSAVIMCSMYQVYEDSDCGFVSITSILLKRAELPHLETGADILLLLIWQNVSLIGQIVITHRVEVRIDAVDTLHLTETLGQDDGYAVGKQGAVVEDVTGKTTKPPKRWMGKH